MKRPGGITFLAILHIGSAVYMCFVLMSTGFALLKQKQITSALAIVFGAYLVIQVLFILTSFAVGFGLWSLKEWARKGAIILTGISLTYLMSSLGWGLILALMGKPQVDWSGHFGHLDIMNSLSYPVITFLIFNYLREPKTQNLFLKASGESLMITDDATPPSASET